MTFTVRVVRRNSANLITYGIPQKGDHIVLMSTRTGNVKPGTLLYLVLRNAVILILIPSFGSGRISMNSLRKEDPPIWVICLVLWVYDLLQVVQPQDLVPILTAAMFSDVANQQIFHVTLLGYVALTLRSSGSVSRGNGTLNYTSVSSLRLRKENGPTPPVVT
jgi:hypothetical protein